jgi:hypothetical protein
MLLSSNTVALPPATGPLGTESNQAEDREPDTILVIDPDNPPSSEKQKRKKLCQRARPKK